MNNAVKFVLKTVGRGIAPLSFVLMLAVSLIGCDENDFAAANYAREERTAKYQSEFALSINKLELSEGNFENFRRITFYNVRLGEVVFVCEGLAHVRIDSDGDVEIVVKTGKGKYMRHYLGQKQDITYFSEQLEATEGIDASRYKIIWNPKLWIPSLEIK